MSLLIPRTTYKPIEYDWAFEAYDTQQQLHWMPREVTLHDDIEDWNTKLNDAERNLLTQIFRFFTQSDVDVAQGYFDKFIPVFRPPEIRMMLGSFANTESIHIHAYSLLLDTIGMPETEYQAFQQYEEMANKHQYVEKFDPTIFTDIHSDAAKREIAKTLAVYSAFTEGLQLFSSFAILLNFGRHDKMVNMCTIIDWSIKDESLHVESMIKLFRTFIEENSRIWTDDLRKELYDICRKMVELEDAFIDLAFEQGGVEGLSKADVKNYIRYIADRRLIQLGLKPNYGVKENPLDWLDWILNAPKHDNFFEKRSTEYSKVNYTGDWGGIWA